MADYITIDASAMDSINYKTALASYFASLGTTAGTSTYYGGVPYMGDTQVGFRYTTDPANNAQVLIEGTDLAYDGMYGQGHGISGNVDGFTLGYYDENTTSTVVDEETGEVSELTGVISGLVVSGLDYSAAIGDGTGTDNLVYQIYNALRKATTTVDLDSDGTSGAEYIDYIYELLSAKAQNFVGSAGDDTYAGTDFGDLVEGNKGNDKLRGGLGDDDIHGGRGIDKLYGEAGADTFFFATGDSAAKQKNADTIFDFERSDGDLFDLTAIDGNEKLADDQALDFIGKHAFTGDAGELRFEKIKGETYIYGDTDGNRKADFTIHLDDAIGLKAADFLL